ncbi:MAG: ATP-dependent DNA helicase [Verrucomicrobiales bacterium]
MAAIKPTEPSASPKSLATRVSGMFSETGQLSKSVDFEYRPQQQDMATRVAAALERNRALVVEAGTGVGKSLAYLVPAVLHAVEKGRKAVISTHTINLQEQLVHKDIPVVQKLLARDLSFKAVLLKGRQNYLCPRRLERAQRQSDDLFTSAEIQELRTLYKWSRETRDGTLSTLPFTPDPKVWSQVCSETHACTARRCGLEGGCFYQEVRKQIGEAHVVVLNHTLLFTLLANAEAEETAGAGDSFLFPNDFLIIDEAHTLENVAARQLGLQLSQGGLRTQIQRLYNPRTRKGLLPAVLDGEAVKLAAALLDELETFFGHIERACRFPPPAREFRVRTGGLAEHSAAAAFLALEVQIAKRCERLDEGSHKLELLEGRRRLTAARVGIRQFLDQDLDGHVYWVEKGQTPAESVALRTAPIDVAEALRGLLFGKTTSCVLTSATLGMGEDDLRYFRRRVGADTADAARIGSPFDYRRQMKLYLVANMPEPRAPGFEEALEKWIAHFLTMSQGRAFVLFTSYRLLQTMAGRLDAFCAKKGWNLLVQGRDKPRHQLIREFRESGSSVLFGTESFWTGVDVPGEALSNVIITRLPFAVPDHPVTASRLEAIEERGGNPFMEYSVPEAVLKLRQGLGRLIRTAKDRGIAVILDNRVLTKQYGRVFLDALPDAPREILR